MICFLNLQLFLNFTAKGCLKKVVDYGKSVLSESLASLFEFSLTLPSASPRLVLYRQLAEDSLSLFPLADDVSSNIVNESDFDPNDKIKDKKSEPLLLGINPGAPSGKCCWVDVGSMIFFDVPSFQSWLQGHKSVTDGDFQQPELFEIDHIHPHSSIGSPVAILYGALGLDCFKDFHVALVHAARQGKVTYVVRPLLASGCESKLGSCGAIGTKGPVNLVGYGVELALKNMEYKAMDDSSVKKGTLAAAYDMIVSEVKWMGKPDKIIYTSDAEIVDTEASKCIAVGDSLHHDIKGAIVAGMASVFVTRGTHVAELWLTYPSYLM